MGQNGQEKDVELGAGMYTAEYWEYDARIGRRWNVDPIDQVSISNYACFANNPILLTDPLGDRVKYGSDNASREDRRRIRRQVRHERKVNEAFKKEFKDMRKSSDLYVFLDHIETVMINGESVPTNATIHDKLVSTKTGNSDKKHIVGWDIGKIVLPQSFDFVGGEYKMQDEKEFGIARKLAEQDILKPVNHRFKFDPIKYQIELWLSLDKNKRSITFVINGDKSEKGSFGGGFFDELLSPDELFNKRKQEILSALKLNKKQINIIRGESEMRDGHTTIDKAIR